MNQKNLASINDYAKHHMTVIERRMDIDRPVNGKHMVVTVTEYTTEYNESFWFINGRYSPLFDLEVFYQWENLASIESYTALTDGYNHLYTYQYVIAD